MLKILRNFFKKSATASGVPNNKFSLNVDRRRALKTLVTGGVAGAALAKTSCSTGIDAKTAEVAALNWEEYFKGNYRVMSREERTATVERLEKMHQLKKGTNISVSSAEPVKDVLYGYAFNVSKCQGYMDCVKACVEENNQDRKTDMQYIRIFEVKNGDNVLEHGNSQIAHDVPVPGHHYMGTQCFQCENPPCVDVCPVGATWKEDDGIVVIDYDWCIGCRYCEAACPYWARRFNWSEPELPPAELNENQHYLGNRPRKQGVMEKCTYCIQRTRTGQNPACVDACPTGARIFGNLLDPDSEIRQVLSEKKVFRLKEDLGTEPKFWYFMD